MSYLKIKNIFLAGLMILNASCKDFLDEDSFNTAAEDEQWRSVIETRSGLMGVYGLVRASLLENDTHWVCGDLRKGDFLSYNRRDLQAVIEGNLRTNYDFLNEISNWRRFYAAINAASVFIEKAPKVLGVDPKYSEANLKVDVAQARALRAFTYFYMARIWGNVPLVTQSYDNGSFPEIGQADVRTVMNYAESEIRAVLETLPFSFSTAVGGQYYGKDDTYWEGELFNKNSAYTLLAHIAAWKGNYADVEAWASAVLDNVSYLQYGTPIENLVETDISKESLFGSKSIARLIGFGSGYDYRESATTGHIEELTLGYPLVQRIYPQIYVPKDTIFSIFDELEDLRFGYDTATSDYTTNYFYSINTPVPIFSKINIVKDGKSDGDYAVFGSSIIFSRWEELALLRAEALVALNKPTDALNILNELRSYRGFTQSLIYSRDFKNNKILLVKAIFAERRKELMGEGWRWYDQIRYQKLVGDNAEWMNLLQSDGGLYWPVAGDVLQSNSQLAQNNYWN